MIKEELRKEINSALKIDPSTSYTVEEPPQNIGGDLASNILLSLSKKNRKAPDKLAPEIIETLSKSKLIKKVEFQKPGFLNFYISDSRLHDELEEAIRTGNQYPVINAQYPRKILIEFVSANPTGPLHVGHGRGAVIGDALARIFTKTGHKTNKEYYINDLGMQVYNLGKTIQLQCLLGIGSKLAEEQLKWRDEFAYKGEYVKGIAAQIAAETGLDSDEKINSRDPRELGEIAAEKILEIIRKDLADFNITFDNWASEKKLFQSGIIDETLRILKEKNYTYEKDDALWFKSTEFGDEKDRVLVRKNDAETYFANDVSYHREKFMRGFDRLIDIWGADHHGYVKRVKSAIKALGYDENNIEIILYQLVSLSRDGKPVMMSKRAGELITLSEVIEEIGADMCRFFMLTRSPDSHLEFDLEVAKKHSMENPVYYIQYAHTRCCGILREAEKLGIAADFSKANFALLAEEIERDILKKILFFPEIIRLSADKLSPHYLTVYLHELAGKFHRYYDKCRVIVPDDRELTAARLAVIAGIKITIANALSLLGVSSPEKM